MVRSVLLFSVLALLWVLVGCKKDEEKPKTGEVVVDATAWDTWNYFSFKEGKLVQVSDPQSDKSWDIGLCRQNVRTNSGLSGKGNGGAWMSDAESLTDKITLPGADKFEVDRMYFLVTNVNMQTGAMTTSMEPLSYVMTSCKVKVEQGADGQWHIVYEVGANGKKKEVLLEKPTFGIVLSEGMPPRDTYNPKVFVVRCADGKFAKFKLLDFTDAKKKRGHVKFQYEYPVK